MVSPGIIVFNKYLIRWNRRDTMFHSLNISVRKSVIPKHLLNTYYMLKTMPGTADKMVDLR